MKKVWSVSLACMIIFSIVFISCKKDNATEAVLSKDIKNIVPDTTLQKIINLGMPINRGTSPTNLVGIYKASPFTLKATTVPNDYSLGYVFSDYKFRLYDQDNVNLTIKLDYVNGPETGTGLGGFISGNGNNFSVFIKVHSYSSSYPADVLHLISGTITNGSISNFYFSNFMLDNFGNTNYWMGNGKGRVFYDSDNNSPAVANLQAIINDKTIEIMGASKSKK